MPPWLLEPGSLDPVSSETLPSVLSALVDARAAELTSDRVVLLLLLGVGCGACVGVGVGVGMVSDVVVGILTEVAAAAFFARILRVGTGSVSAFAAFLAALAVELVSA